MYFLLKMGIFLCYVSFPAGTYTIRETTLNVGKYTSPMDWYGSCVFLAFVVTQLSCEPDLFSLEAFGRKMLME